MVQVKGPLGASKSQDVPRKLDKSSQRKGHLKNGLQNEYKLDKQGEVRVAQAREMK